VHILTKYVALHLLITIFVEISVGDSHTDPSPSYSDKKDGQMRNSRIGDTEIKRTLRYLTADISKL
jgi:hypothetical protein